VIEKWKAMIGVAQAIHDMGLVYSPVASADRANNSNAFIRTVIEGANLAAVLPDKPTMVSLTEAIPGISDAPQFNEVIPNVPNYEGIKLSSPPAFLVKSAKGWPEYLAEPTKHNFMPGLPVKGVYLSRIEHNGERYRRFTIELLHGGLVVQFEHESEQGGILTFLLKPDGAKYRLVQARAYPRGEVGEDIPIEDVIGDPERLLGEPVPITGGRF
jgi:hypothetical protein